MATQIHNLTEAQVKSPAIPTHLIGKEGRNPMYALFAALSKTQESMSKMQITDAKMTEIAASIQSTLYQYYNGQLDAIVLEMKDAKGDKLTKLQTEYSTMQAKANTAQTELDGVITSSQAQVQADGQNLATFVQNMNIIYSILGTLTNFLGRA